MKFFSENSEIKRVRKTSTQSKRGDYDMNAIMFK